MLHRRAMHALFEIRRQMSIVVFLDDYLITTTFNNNRACPHWRSEAMKYMLLIYVDEHALSETERQACYVESTQLAREIKARGQYLAANPLYPTDMATTVRVRDGKRYVTDGPFAETHEQLGGYFLIDAKHLDEAIGLAARIPMARKGTVEIRPVIEIAGLPTDA